MRLLIITTAIMTSLEAFRVAICYMRKDVLLIKKVFESLILIGMIVLCFFNLNYDMNTLLVCLSILFCLYVFGMFIYERISRREYISVLSVKEAIDMSNTGIMFLDRDGEVILINNVMANILNYFNIKCNYLDSLIKVSFKVVGNSYLIKIGDFIYQLRVIDDTEVYLSDVTILYKLSEREEVQNRKIEDNNNKILNTISNIEKIEKGRHLLKIKNEYHDLLGHRLALFTKYLDQDKKSVEDIVFLLDSIYDNDNSDIDSSVKLKNMIKMYKIVGVNINIDGSLPSDDKIALVFFEIIREAVTNAIIHADSKNIYVVITTYLSKIEMVITNDGKRQDGVIFVGDGINGMKMKVSSLGGTLNIINDDGFMLKIVI